MALPQRSSNIPPIGKGQQHIPQWFVDLVLKDTPLEQNPERVLP